MHFAETFREKLLLLCLSILNILYNLIFYIFSTSNSFGLNFFTNVFSVRMEIPCTSYSKYAHTCMRTYICKYLRVHTNEHTHKQTPSHALTPSQALTRPHSHRCRHSHILTLTCTYTCRLSYL